MLHLYEDNITTYQGCRSKSKKKRLLSKHLRVKKIWIYNSDLYIIQDLKKHKGIHITIQIIHHNTT